VAEPHVKSSITSRPKFSCGLALRVRPAVEEDEHRGVLRDSNEEIPELAEGHLANQLVVPLRTRGLTALVRHHLRADDRADRTGHLRVADAEVVVPEERHLLLQRAARVHHAEQPPLPRILDAGVRRNCPRAVTPTNSGSPIFESTSSGCLSKSRK
jgi:hypothetical protein